MTPDFLDDFTSPAQEGEYLLVDLVDLFAKVIKVHLGVSWRIRLIGPIGLMGPGDFAAGQFE